MDDFTLAALAFAHPRIVDEHVRRQELAAVPGQVECSHDHSELDACAGRCDVCAAGETPRCPSCGAAV